MKNQNNQRLQTVLLAPIATIFLFGALSSIFAQAGSGAKYGTRDPRTCADTKAPAKGAMTAALATKYIICAAERVSGENLYLIEDLTGVQVGGSRPYSYNTDSVADIDVTARVYPFRTGSYKKYQCAAVYQGNKGYNCNIYPVTKASGACRKSTFGDWRCSLDNPSDDQSKIENNVPPPTAAKVGATPKSTVAPKTSNQTATTKTGAANENKEDAGLPKPDFSEMEKYFEIVKSEYSAEGSKLIKLNLVLKMTKQTNVCEWAINFYDADGVKVVAESYIVGNDTCAPKLGEPTKAYAYLPPEAKWKFVKKVVITKWIH